MSVIGTRCTSPRMCSIPNNPVLRDVIFSDPNRAQVPKVLVIVDEALASANPFITRNIEEYFSAHSDHLKLVCTPLVIEGGERTKNSYFHVSEIHSQIDRYHIDRHSYVIAVGGGALLDMAGFAAATAHRGVRHIRIPTTTLSQDDSGVGVKNGINAFGKRISSAPLRHPMRSLTTLSFWKHFQHEINAPGLLRL